METHADKVREAQREHAVSRELKIIELLEEILKELKNRPQIHYGPYSAPATPAPFPQYPVYPWGVPTCGGRGTGTPA